MFISQSNFKNGISFPIFVFVHIYYIAFETMTQQFIKVWYLWKKMITIQRWIQDFVFGGTKYSARGLETAEGLQQGQDRGLVGRPGGRIIEAFLAATSKHFIREVINLILTVILLKK